MNRSFWKNPHETLQIFKWKLNIFSYCLTTFVLSSLLLWEVKMYLSNMYNSYHAQIWIIVKLCIVKIVILNCILNIILIVFMLPMMKTGLYTSTHIHKYELFHLKFLIVFFLFLVPNNWLIISAGFYSTELWNLSVYAINKKICWNIRKIHQETWLSSSTLSDFWEDIEGIERSNWLSKSSLLFLKKKTRETQILFIQWINPQFGVWGA